MTLDALPNRAREPADAAPSLQSKIERVIAILSASILLVSLTSCHHKQVVRPTAAIPTPARKAANIVLAVDRSGSLKLTNSCEPLKAAATNFLNQFTPGRDKIGLVTFASSTYVNFPISQDFQTANPNIAAILAKIDCAGSTSTAQALWTSYQQLITLNEPDAVNVILLSTDGNPSGVTFDMPVANSSPCSEYTPGSTKGAGAYTMPPEGKGYIRGVYSTFSNISRWFGLLNPNGITGSDGQQIVTNGDIQPAVNSAGCAYYTGWSEDGGIHNMTSIADFLGVPRNDINGNSANTAYRPVTLNSLGFIDIDSQENAMAIPLNVADSAATKIRNGAIDSISGRGLNNVIIYSIVLGSAPFPFSSEFLNRISNDLRSPIFDPKKHFGVVFRANVSAELQQAFSAAAAEILRAANQTVAIPTGSHPQTRRSK